MNWFSYSLIDELCARTTHLSMTLSKLNSNLGKTREQLSFYLNRMNQKKVSHFEKRCRAPQTSMSKP